MERIPILRMGDSVELVIAAIRERGVAVGYSGESAISLNAQSGTVKITLPDARELTETISVEDVFVVAMGDSFMSGESNPDRPVSFSPSRAPVGIPFGLAPCGRDATVTGIL